MIEAVIRGAVRRAEPRSLLMLLTHPSCGEGPGELKGTALCPGLGHIALHPPPVPGEAGGSTFDRGTLCSGKSRSISRSRGVSCVP